MKKFFLTLLSLTFFCGCVSPKYNYYPETKEISEPPLNTIVSAYVGDAMLRQGKYSHHDSIYLRKNIKIGSLSTYTLTRGYYIKKGEDAKSEFYLPVDGFDSGQVIEGALADPFQIIRLDKKSGKLCVVTIFKFEDCTSKADYEKKKYPIATSDSFQQTLIYSGKLENKINIGYREFSNDFARPAFNNDVEYDLSESKIIGYKGARIEVVEATNEYIKYKVIQNFNRAEY
jgi:hypothetical protein